MKNHLTIVARRWGIPGVRNQSLETLLDAPYAREARPGLALGQCVRADRSLARPSTAAVRLAAAPPRDWLEILNTSPSDAEEEQVKQHIERSRPMGAEAWVKSMASALGLQHTLNPRGRPVGWRKHKPMKNDNKGSRHVQFSRLIQSFLLPSRAVHGVVMSVRIEGDMTL